MNVGAVRRTLMTCPQCHLSTMIILAMIIIPTRSDDQWDGKAGGCAVKDIGGFHTFISLYLSTGVDFGIYIVQR
jgi:hypothetical protein